MKHKLFTLLVLLPVLFFEACGYGENEDVLFDGEYPNVTNISYSENGEHYEIQAIAGHCIVFFSDTVSQPMANEIIKAAGGKIIEQIPVFNYFLVKVGEGDECGFVTAMKQNNCVEFAYFNTIVQFMSEAFIMDDFVDIEETMLTTHGNGVRKIFSKYSASDNIHSVHIAFLNENDTLWKKETTASNIYISNLFGIAKGASNDDITLINMSFGPKLPGKTKKTDKYNDVDSVYQASYRSQMVSELKLLAKCFDKMRTKGISDFIVFKSSGNDSFYNMETVIDRLNEKTINSLKKNLVIVCAYDTKSKVLYSNYPKQKHPLLTTVDASQEPWCGTSFATPKLMGFVDKIHSKYENLNARELLQAIRNATPDDPREPMTYEQLEREARKIAEGNEERKRYTFRLDMTSNYSGKWKISDEIVKYEVHNTFAQDYLNGDVKGIYIENSTGHNLNLKLSAIDADSHISPMHYTLAADEEQGFFAYETLTMDRISVRTLEVQLSIW